nr:hypothetical protein [Xanthomonas cassavae]
MNSDASQARIPFNIATGKQESLTPVFNKQANDLDAQLGGNVRYNATDDRIEQVQDTPFQESVASIKDKIRRNVRASMTEA